ncbi:MAG: hypothetical protein ACKPEO_21115 [Sphaerospermopsis kisseleviana]|nr:hypothetical protein [Sphaerospermopsis sp. LEGE 00249]
MMRFEGGNLKNGKVTMVMVRRDCNSGEFVFSPSDRSLKCQF